VRGICGRRLVPGPAGVYGRASSLHLSLLRSFSNVALLLVCSLRRWKVYADAGWFLDLPAFTDPAQRPMRAIAQALQLGYNATFDATCMSQLQPGQVG